MDRYNNKRINRLTKRSISKNHSTWIQRHIAVLSFLVGSAIAAIQATTGYLQYDTAQSVKMQTDEIKRLSELAVDTSKLSLAQVEKANQSAVDNLEKIDVLHALNIALSKKFISTQIKLLLQDTAPNLAELYKSVDVSSEYGMSFLFTHFEGARTLGSGTHILVPLEQWLNQESKRQTQKIINVAINDREIKAETVTYIRSLTRLQNEICDSVTTDNELRDCKLHYVSYAYFDFIVSLFYASNESLVKPLIENELILRRIYIDGHQWKSESERERIVYNQEHSHYFWNKGRGRKIMRQTQLMTEILVESKDFLDQDFLSLFFDSIPILVFDGRISRRLLRDWCSELDYEKACDVSLRPIIPGA